LKHTKARKHKNDAGTHYPFFMSLINNMLSDYTLEDIQSPFDPIGPETTRAVEDDDFEPDASDTSVAGGEEDDDETLKDIQSPFDPIGPETTRAVEDDDFEPDASDTSVTGGEDDDDEVDSDYAPESDNNTTPDSLKRHRLFGHTSCFSL
jgi:hypothetical protein